MSFNKNSKPKIKIDKLDINDLKKLESNESLVSDRNQSFYRIPI